MEKFKYYSRLLELSYNDMVEHLLQKYGRVTDNYYVESSYQRFLNNEIKSIAKGKGSRTSDGLFIHHIKENEYKKMADLIYIREQNIPFEFQKKDQLVYCDLVEHMVLHTLIAEETDGRFGAQGLFAYIIPDVSDWYVGEQVPTIPWKINCYNKSFLTPEEAVVIIRLVKERLLHLRSW